MPPSEDMIDQVELHDQAVLAWAFHIQNLADSLIPEYRVKLHQLYKDGKIVKQANLVGNTLIVFAEIEGFGILAMPVPPYNWRYKIPQPSSN